MFDVSTVLSSKFIFVGILINLIAILLPCQSMDTSIPDSPSSVCVSGMETVHLNSLYKYNETRAEWVHIYNESVIIGVDSMNQTWVIVYMTPQTHAHVYDYLEYSYCQEMGNDVYYHPEKNEPGNPNDCKTWYPSGVTVTSDLSTGECVSFDTKLTMADYASIAACGVIVIILVIVMTPRCKVKLCQENEATQLETYQKILTLKGINPMSPRSEKDPRPVGEMLLRRDIRLNKVAWYGQFWKDFVTYIKLKHMFFSMFYGSKFDEIRRTDHVLIFIMIQALTGANSFLVTYIQDAYFSNAHDSSEKIGYLVTKRMWSFLLSFSITIIEGLSVRLASCHCVEYNSYKCIRKCCYSVSSLVISILWVFTGLYCYVLIKLVLYEFNNEENFDESIDVRGFIEVFIVRLIVTQFEGIFIIDMGKRLFQFRGAWRRQTGKYKGSKLYSNPHCNCCCCNSWLCCWCLCYYCCCIKHYQSKVYIVDTDGNVIGKQNEEFGITWVEYQCYKNDQAMPEREYTRVARSIGSSIDLMTTQTLVDSQQKMAVTQTELINLDDTDHGNAHGNDHENEHDTEHEMDQDSDIDHHAPAV